MRELKIGALAKAGGVGIETVRFYQRKGLLEIPPRTSGSVRRYTEAALDRLAFIRRARDVGFTLDEVASLITLSSTPECRGARALAAQKLEQVEARLGNLRRMRRALVGLIAQCDAGDARCCPIIESLARGRRAAI